MIKHHTLLYYRGSLTDKKAIYLFINEVEDIASSLDWRVSILDESWTTKPDAQLEVASSGKHLVFGNTALKGIALYPTFIDLPIHFFFNASCVLTTRERVARSASENYPVDHSWLSLEFTVGGKQMESAVLNLMTYLKSKYLHDLEIKLGEEEIICHPFDSLSENSSDIIDKLEKALRELGS
jgi:hypothetical protein